MKYYDEYDSVEELYEAYNIKPLSQFLVEDSAKEKAKKELDKKDPDDPEKVVKTDKLEVIYAEPTKKYNNIFKHIIVFTNDRDTKNNKTLKNIEDAIKRLKKDKAEVVPELHVFVAAEIQADDDGKVTVVIGGKEKQTKKK